MKDWNAFGVNGASKATWRWLKLALIVALVMAGFRARRAEPFQAAPEKSGGEAARPDFQQEIQPIFESGPVRAEREDPWWDYHVAQARNADALLDQLRRPFLQQGR